MSIVYHQATPTLMIGISTRSDSPAIQDTTTYSPRDQPCCQPWHWEWAALYNWCRYSEALVRQFHDRIFGGVKQAGLKFDHSNQTRPFKLQVSTHVACRGVSLADHFTSTILQVDPGAFECPAAFCSGWIQLGYLNAPLLSSVEALCRVYIVCAKLLQQIPWLGYQCSQY